MLWGKVIQRRLRPLVEVGDEEVTARMERMRANAGKTEYLVAEIFLRVDDAASESQVENVANSLVAQIKEGANFAAVAQQFSQGAGALQGGDLGWVTQGQLPRELDGALSDLGARGLNELPEWLMNLVQTLNEGETSEPYAVSNGALLVVLCHRDVQGDVGVTREQITQQIGTERLELQARRLLRDIRSEAVVESRIQ